MEVIRSFFTTIRTLFRALRSRLATLINRIAYKITSLVTGKARADKLFHTYRQNKKSARSWWEDNVDTS